MKLTLFENLVTRERLVCDNLRNITVIDGEEYLAVHKENEQRIFLVKKDILARVNAKTKKIVRKK